MDGTVEAHNISFGCGHSAINIALLTEKNYWSRLKYQDFEQRSEKKYGGVGVGGVVTTFLSSLLKSPFSSFILPAQSDTGPSCF